MRVVIINPSLLLLCLWFMLVKDATCLSLQEELTLTYDQKIKLDKFKQLVTPNLPHEYMKEDLYLSRWLRVNNYNIPLAEKMLLENIKWRADNRIDDILSEDFSDFDQEFKISVEGCDHEGRPVISTNIGSWDMRKAVITGKTQRMMRYTDKLLEEGNVLLRLLQENGQNVTQFVELFDLSQFSLKMHGCPQCLAIYSYNFQSYEKHYPLTIHRAISVNTPAYFNTVFNILRPLLSKQTQDIASFYGRDRKEWTTALRKMIGVENLSKNFGGLKEEVWDVEDIRKDHSLYHETCPSSRPKTQSVVSTTKTANQPNIGKNDKNYVTNSTSA